MLVRKRTFVEEKCGSYGNNRKRKEAIIDRTTELAHTFIIRLLLSLKSTLQRCDVVIQWCSFERPWKINWIKIMHRIVAISQIPSRSPLIIGRTP